MFLFSCVYISISFYLGGFQDSWWQQTYFTYLFVQLAPILWRIWNKSDSTVLNVGGKYHRAKPVQSGRDGKPNPRLWSEVGFELGSTDSRGGKAGKETIEPTWAHVERYNTQSDLALALWYLLLLYLLATHGLSVCIAASSGNWCWAKLVFFWWAALCVCSQTFKLATDLLDLGLLVLENESLFSFKMDYYMSCKRRIGR